MQHYALVFFPKINTEKIQEFRKKYDPQWHILPPHITLVFPYSSIKEKQATEHFALIASKTTAFTIQLNGFTKSFDDYLFLLVNKNKEAVFALHDALYTGIFASLLRKDIPFIPHMTLGSFKDKEDKFDEKRYDKARTEVESMKLDISCEFNAMTLIQGDGITPAKIIKTFYFKK